MKHTEKTEYGMGIKIPYKMIHPYYTPFYAKFQGNLAKMTIFVNYADFYVYLFMLTF